MSENGVSVSHLVIKFSRGGLIAATCLEQKGLTQYGVKFFARFIQQTGARRLINMSDGEHTMKSLKDSAAKAAGEGVESTPRESPVGDHQANGAAESAVRSMKAQMRAIRSAL